MSSPADIPPSALDASVSQVAPAIPRLPAENPRTLDEALRKMLQGQSPAVFLDYDGTLSPLVARPELAILDPACRTALKDLAALCPLAIVSGRERPAVMELVGLGDSLAVAGSHGLDIMLAGGDLLPVALPDDIPSLIKGCQEALAACLKPFAGHLIERKHLSVAVHYRGVSPTAHETLRNAVLKTMAPHIAPPSGPPSLKVKPGKMVLEFLPFLDWDKGKAITHLFERPEFGAQGCMPLFIGDDVTDEDGFRDVNRLGGISLLVHDPLRDDPTRASLAQRRLADCDQVTAVLQALIRLLKAPIDQQPTSQPSQPRGSDSPEAAGS